MSNRCCLGQDFVARFRVQMQGALPGALVRSDQSQHELDSPVEHSSYDHRHAELACRRVRPEWMYHSSSQDFGLLGSAKNTAPVDQLTLLQEAAASGATAGTERGDGSRERSRGIRQGATTPNATLPG